MFYVWVIVPLQGSICHDYANFPGQSFIKMSLLIGLRGCLNSSLWGNIFGFSDHLYEIRWRISVTALAKLLISLAAKDALSRCRSRRGSLASFLSARELNPKPSDKCFWNEVMDRFCKEGWFLTVDEIIWNSAAIRSVTDLVHALALLLFTCYGEIPLLHLFLVETGPSFVVGESHDEDLSYDTAFHHMKWYLLLNAGFIDLQVWIPTRFDLSSWHSS